MRVCEVYKEINLDDLFDRAETSEYWNSAHKFVQQVWDKEVDELSQKQIDWLDRILEGMN